MNMELEFLVDTGSEVNISIIKNDDVLKNNIIVNRTQTVYLRIIND